VITPAVNQEKMLIPIDTKALTYLEPPSDTRSGQMIRPMHVIATADSQFPLSARLLSGSTSLGVFDPSFPVQSRKPADWLREALQELQEADHEAEQEGFRTSSITAKNNAKQILESLSRGPWPAPVVYPTADGEIAIFFKAAGAEAAVLILCDSDGGGACFASIFGENRRARYSDAGYLPDEFVKRQLRDLQFAAVD
jgi:hypothetical protein